MPDTAKIHVANSDTIDNVKHNSNTGIVDKKKDRDNSTTGDIIINNNKSLEEHLEDESEMAVSSRRKALFGDCALIEIIHLHECLRGALKALERDVNHLVIDLQEKKQQQQSENVANDRNDSNDYDADNENAERIRDLERRVAGRFKVIWSVFRAHSSAEDEFIWPALRMKTQRRIKSTSSSSKGVATGESSDSKADFFNANAEVRMMDDEALGRFEYEEDHADEERMFSEMDRLLASLRDKLMEDSRDDLDASDERSNVSVDDVARSIRERTKTLSQHLRAHLDKEETKCMPLVLKHLSKSEIHELVGKIMGKRSADTIANIMTMAVQNLAEEDREEMVKYMKQSMAGTFFDRWLLMSGWMSSPKEDSKPAADETKKRGQSSPSTHDSNEVPIKDEKRARLNETDQLQSLQIGSSIKIPDHATMHPVNCASGLTSQEELEKLIRAVATNPELNAQQKNTMIQGLRDSVWRSNQRYKQMHLPEGPPVNVNASCPHVAPNFLSDSSPAAATATTSSPTTSSSSSSSRTRRVTPPSMYFKKTKNGKVELVWSIDSPSSVVPDDGTVPLFSAEELAPTYHDGAAGTVLGCPHYSRACKLRHPRSGRLYTCRLCCQQQRELPMKDRDEPLDRYAVTEVMCMTCTALQPSEDRCMNRDCEYAGKPFAKYFCRICHLYDNGSRPIFHCPYCNVCRLGKGLGIDFRHCMHCNACVSLSDSDHRCIPQKLQGTCPICSETLFLSTEPLKGLKCGHVMHLSCFSEYRRGHNYTCPLCMRSMEDMSEYFALLDAAVRMQPMPAAYLSTMSNIYCQDCCKTGQVQYHFVGQKCGNCGSYNTRELGRVHNSPTRQDE